MKKAVFILLSFALLISIFTCVKANEEGTNLVNHVIKVAVEIDEPRIDMKPSYEAKALTKGYKVTGVHWSPEDDTFKEGIAYNVSFDIELDDGYLLRSDYFGLVNGHEAEMPYEYTKENFLSYTFPKLEKEGIDDL